MAKKSSKETPPATRDAPREPASRSVSPFREFERLLDGLFERGWRHPMHWEQPLRERFAALEGQVPKIDVIDRDNEVVLRAEIPGFEREDLDVSVTDTAVTLKGEQRQETQEEEGEYYYSEISRGAFTRTVPLPGEVDADKATASFKNGLLELVLPKLQQATRRKVEVK
ncbi:Hsp20/alpha crystallin family protein [Halomonas cerina]|uniref:HSP20 family protein n=1 Tax=Halomonas cerina TaxID=447424 RepID=A0A839V3C6_9GAMM|nr:Hsp20/alpha crystallin family protein [Halomonas cerina]MBB3189862.1 HSP20 family protein [Halomonas cerina]